MCMDANVYSVGVTPVDKTERARLCSNLPALQNSIRLLSRYKSWTRCDASNLEMRFNTDHQTTSCGVNLLPQSATMAEVYGRPKYRSSVVQNAKNDWSGSDERSQQANNLSLDRMIGEWRIKLVKVGAP